MTLIPHSSARLFPRKSLSYARIVDTLFAAFPVELRVEIFRLVCGDYCPIDKNNVGPLLLMRVSRVWKNLVVQTPQLWSSFSLDVQRPLPGRRLTNTLKRWLDQSRSAPVSFVLHYPVLDATCTKILHEFLLASGRWRDVTLRAPSASLLPLWEAKPENFPVLRSLTIETVGLAPFLIRDLGISWAQLAKLDLFLITIPTLDECLDILERSVNLTSCSMNAICVLDAQDVQRLELPKLKVLQLKLYNGDPLASSASETNFHAFLDALNCPGLRSVSIGWNLTLGPPRWSHPDKLATFLRQMGGHLESLHLAYLPFDTRQVLSALESVPFLRQLRLSLSQADPENDFINNDFFRALTLPSALLPLLESMRLDCHGESFSNAVLLRFITSRWKYQHKGGCLEQLEIISPKRRAEYVSKRFRDLREGKLDVGASLKSESDMLAVLRGYMERDSYDTICFMNSDFSRDIRSLLVL
ncbi:hypothetical protein C8F01DRAFT_581675 [Mycena amicta]|nr:hypothetical protein C8F01DRAFT_581675 [Mycena amicta]